MISIVQKRPGNKGVIIFVHGFIGGGHTWIPKDAGKSLLNHLAESESITDRYDVGLFTYFTRITDFFEPYKWAITKAIARVIPMAMTLKSNLPVSDISRMLESEIRVKCRDYNSVILIAHSMGGLIAKSYILEELKKGRDLKVDLFVSLAVPHRGSDLATFGRALVENRQIRDLGPLSRTVNEMNDEWNTQNKLPKTIYFRGMHDTIVTKYSAVSVTSQEPDIINTGHDHFSIVRSDPNDIVFQHIVEECSGLPQEREVQPALFRKNVRFRGKKQVQIREASSFEPANEKLRTYLMEGFGTLPFFTRKICGKHNETYTFETLADKIEHTDLSVIWGIGGLGKSVLLRRIAYHYAAKYPQSCIVYCDAHKWNDAYSEHLGKQMSPATRYTNLLLAFRSKQSFADISRQPQDPDQPSFLFVDGLNQISDKKLRGEIIDTLFELHVQLKLRVCVVSRYRNRIEFMDWDFFEVMKIDMDVLAPILLKSFNKKPEDYTPRTLEYLRIPYFLHIAMTDLNDTIKSYSTYIFGHALKNVEPEKQNEVLHELSELAYTTYLSKHKFEVREDEVQKEKLEYYVAKKILLEAEDGYQFEHHLVNEFFVAHKIANDRSLWNRESFDLITLENRISFEIIQMILEQIGNPETGDAFLTEVYNWNFYAMLHCLKNVEESYSREFAAVMILVLSEKLFDRFNHTKRRVKEYLAPLYQKFDISGFSAEDLERYLSEEGGSGAAAEFVGLVRRNEEHFRNNRFSDWYKIFTYENDEPELSYVDNIVTRNPIDGWSCANVLKRFRFTPEVENHLIDLCRKNEDPIVRWRIVHALGNAIQPESTDFLLELLADPLTYPWVKYGAIRSLLEVALFSSDVEACTVLLQKLKVIFENSIKDKLIADEFRSCLTAKIEKDKQSLVAELFDQIIASPNASFADKSNWLNAKTSFHENNS